MQDAASKVFFASRPVDSDSTGIIVSRPREIHPFTYRFQSGSGKSLREKSVGDYSAASTRHNALENSRTAELTFANLSAASEP